MKKEFLKNIMSKIILRLNAFLRNKNVMNNIQGALQEVMYAKLTKLFLIMKYTLNLYFFYISFITLVLHFSFSLFLLYFV